MIDNTIIRRPSWRIRGNLGRRTHLLISLAGLLLPVGWWWWISAGGAVDPIFLPTPPLVIDSVLNEPELPTITLPELVHADLAPVTVTEL